MREEESKRLKRLVNEVKSAPDTPAVISILAEDRELLALTFRILTIQPAADPALFEDLDRICREAEATPALLKKRLTPAARALGLPGPEETTGDFYEVLGVSPGASPAEVRKAYLIRARDLHPDIHPDIKPQEFALLAEAYRVFSSPDLREAYDASHRKVDPDWAERSPVFMEEAEKQTQGHRRKRRGLVVQLGLVLLAMIIGIGVASYLFEQQALREGSSYVQAPSNAKGPATVPETRPSPAVQLAANLRQPVPESEGQGAGVRNQESGIRGQGAGGKEQRSDVRYPMSEGRGQEAGVPGETPSGAPSELFHGASRSQEAEGQGSGVRSQGSGGRGQGAGGRGQGAGGKEQRSDVRYPMSEGRGQEAGVPGETLSGTPSELFHGASGRKGKAGTGKPAEPVVKGATPTEEKRPEPPIETPAASKSQDQPQKTAGLSVMPTKEQGPTPHGPKAPEPVEARVKPRPVSGTPASEQETPAPSDRPSPPSRPKAGLKEKEKDERSAETQILAELDEMALKASQPAHPQPDRKPAKPEPIETRPIEPVPVKPAEKPVEPPRVAQPVIEPTNVPQQPIQQTQAIEKPVKSPSVPRREIQDFIKAYCQAYENLNYSRFMGYFAPDAVENDQSVRQLEATYRENFERLDALTYDIRVKDCRVTPAEIEVTGDYRLRWRFREDDWREREGPIVLGLIPVNASFQVKRLVYH